MVVTGRLALLVLLGVPAAVLAGGWGVLGWALVTCAAVLLDVALAASPRTVSVRRSLPPSVRLGEPCTSDLLVTHTGPRHLRGVLRDAWPPSAGAAPGADRHRLDVPSGERRRYRTPLRPTRRGDRAAGAVTVRALGPLRLAGRQVSLPVEGRLRVLPPFTSRRHLPAKLARLRDLDGRSAVRLRGQGTEFDSLRDYVDGDDVRSIDWRATARRQHVVVRTWRPERDRRVLLVLDTSRTSAARVGDQPRLDAAMDAALLLAALATRAGDRVDLVAVDRRVRARVSGSKGAQLLQSLVQAMAPLEPALVEADWSAVTAEVLDRLNHRALVVLLTPLDAGAAEEGLLPAVPVLARRHTVVVASVTDPELTRLAAGRGDADAAVDAAAAARGELERDALESALRRAGAEVVEGDPEDLPPRLADTYLALKAAGRL
ncbi:DUF58 domain-containing protein [Thalassiella azotivora]